MEQLIGPKWRTEAALASFVLLKNITYAQEIFLGYFKTTGQKQFSRREKKII